MTRATYTFAVEGMHCGSCSLLIDDVLEDLPGVLSTSTSRKAGRTVVEADPAGCTPEQVTAAIAEAGYQARQVISSS